MKSLEPGQSIELLDADGEPLSELVVALGWGRKKSKGLIGLVKAKKVDLDASCLLYDAKGNPVDFVFFNKLSSEDGAVVHSGDDLQGARSEDEIGEEISVALNKLSDAVGSIVFVVNSYSGDSLGGVPFTFCKILKQGDGDEIAKFHFGTEGMDCKGVIIAKVYPSEGSWRLEAIGETCEGRQQTLQDIEPQARRHAVVTEEASAETDPDEAVSKDVAMVYEDCQWVINCLSPSDFAVTKAIGPFASKESAEEFAQEDSECQKWAWTIIPLLPSVSPSEDDRSLSARASFAHPKQR